MSRAFTIRSRSISGAGRSLNDALYVCIYGGSDRETVINTVIPALTLAMVRLPLSISVSVLPLSRVGREHTDRTGSPGQNNERKTSKRSNETKYEVRERERERRNQKKT